MIMETICVSGSSKSVRRGIAGNCATVENASAIESAPRLCTLRVRGRTTVTSAKCGMAPDVMAIVVEREHTLPRYKSHRVFNWKQRMPSSTTNYHLAAVQPYKDDLID
ncbi:hypothetical protein BM1_09049 [Bipolaris maydis]|nr:hypothetical protein BM1_09049 [Bipolaris maydis]